MHTRSRVPAPSKMKGGDWIWDCPSRDDGLDASGFVPSDNCETCGEAQFEHCSRLESEFANARLSKGRCCAKSALKLLPVHPVPSCPQSVSDRCATVVKLNKDIRGH